MRSRFTSEVPLSDLDKRGLSDPAKLICYLVSIRPHGHCAGASSGNRLPDRALNRGLDVTRAPDPDWAMTAHITPQVSSDSTKT
jgi:hypothetical protein